MDPKPVTLDTLISAGKPLHIIIKGVGAWESVYAHRETLLAHICRVYAMLTHRSVTEDPEMFTVVSSDVTRREVVVRENKKSVNN